MALTLTTADDVLKEDYHGPVAEQLNNADVILAQIDKNTEDIVGRRFVTPLHVGRNRGVGARGEGGTLPTAGNQSYDSVMGPVRYQYARIDLTGPVIAAMKKDRGSFIRALQPEMDGALADAKRNVCRQVWGTSDGVIAQCGTTTTSNTVVLTSPKPHQLRWLEEGLAIDIGTTGSPQTIAADRYITAVDYSAMTVTVSGATISTTSSHFITAHDAYGVSTNTGSPNDGQIELTGLQTMVDDTATLHTLAPSTEPRWKSRVYANSGTLRAITENLVTQAIMNGEIASGQTANLLVASDGVFRSYSNLLTGLRRNMQEVQLKGGYSGVTVSSVKMGRGGSSTQALTWDRDAPSYSLYGLHTDDIVKMELEDWQWMDQTGAVLIQVSGKDEYTATMKAYYELVCRRRNSQWVIRDIREDA